MELIKAALAQLRFELKTSELSVSGTKMFEELLPDIEWIVENSGRSWSEIRNEYPTQSLSEVTCKHREMRARGAIVINLRYFISSHHKK